MFSRVFLVLLLLLFAFTVVGFFLYALVYVNSFFLRNKLECMHGSHAQEQLRNASRIDYTQAHSHASTYSCRGYTYRCEICMSLHVVYCIRSSMCLASLFAWISFRLWRRRWLSGPSLFFQEIVREIILCNSVFDVYLLD